MDKPQTSFCVWLVGHRVPAGRIYEGTFRLPRPSEPQSTKDHIKKLRRATKFQGLYWLGEHPSIEQPIVTTNGDTAEGLPRSASPHESFVPEAPVTSEADDLGFRPLIPAQDGAYSVESGATHVLSCYEEVSDATGHDSKPVVIPVNSMVLLDSCFKTSARSTVRDSLLEAPPTADGRAVGELPRIRFRVPDLDTIGPLLIYFHTGNQAELMRRVVPSERIRDLLHPLPSAPESPRRRALATNVDEHNPSCGMSFTFRFGNGRKGTRFHGRLRTAQSVAQDIADLDASRLVSRGPEESDLEIALRRLGGLKQNLEELEHYGPEVWHEVQASWEILLRAVSLKAKIYPSNSVAHKE